MPRRLLASLFAVNGRTEAPEQEDRETGRNVQYGRESCRKEGQHGHKAGASKVVTLLNMMCMFPVLGRLCGPSLHVLHHILHAIAHGVGIVTQAGSQAIGQPQCQQWLRGPEKACCCKLAQHSVTGVQPAWCGRLPLYCPDTYATVCTH